MKFSVFHDCAGSNKKCDGCVNLSQADNKGLDIPINALDTVYKSDARFATELLAYLKRKSFKLITFE